MNSASAISETANPEKNSASSAASKLDPWRSDPVAVRLRSITFRQRLFNIITVLLAIVLSLFAWAEISMCADRALELTSSTRQIVLICGVIVVIAVTAILATILLLRRLNPLHYAREIDRVLGFEDDALLTYVELRRAKKEGDGEVAQLLSAAAAERVDAIHADQIIDAKPLTRTLFGVLGVLSFMLMLYLAWSGNFSDTFYRCVTPWREIAPPRSLQIIEVSPGDGIAVSGEPVTFAVKVRGKRLPPDASLVYRLDNEDADVEERLASSKDSSFEKQLPGFVRSLSYRVRCGDAESGPYRLRMVERPMVTFVNVKVLPPEYAPNAPAREVAGGNVQAILGSRLEITAEVNQPAKKEEGLISSEIAWLQVGSARVRMASDGKKLTGQLKVERNFEYRVSYVDVNSLLSREGVLYQVKATPDQPPSANLRRDDDDNSRVPANGTVILRADASDDLGCAKLAMRVSIVGELDQSKTRTIELPALRPEQNVHAEIALDMKLVGPKDGDFVECVLLVDDVRKPVAQRAESKPLRVPITAPIDKTPEPKVAVPELAIISDVKVEKDKTQEKAVSIDELSEQEKKLLEELANLAANSLSDEDKKKVAEVASKQEKIADELVDLIRKQAEESASQSGQNSGGNTGEQNGGNKSGDSAEKKNDGNNKGDQSGQNGKQPGDSDKGSQNSNLGQNGNKDGQNGNSGDSSKGNSGDGKQGGNQSGSNPGQNGAQGGQSGNQGAGQSGSQGGKSGSGSQGSGGGQPGGSSNSSGGKSSGSGGQPGGSGQPQGGGDGNSNSSGQGSAQNSGGKNNGSKATGNEGQNSNASSGSMTPGTGAASSAKDRQQIADAAKDLRDGKLDEQTLKKMESAFDHLFNSGRAFNKEDREKLRALNEKTEVQKSAPRKIEDKTEATGPSGKARDFNGSRNNSAGRVNELKEDELGRSSEKGQAKVAPEYRKALEDYYKRLSQ